MAGHYMQTNFTGGEWTPYLEGRTDFEKYGNSLYKLENFLIDPRGPAVFRPGLRYIAGTKTNAKASRLLPFEFSVTQAYVIEFGDQYLRFYRNQGQILSGGNPYEIASPYLEADLDGIKYCQSADVLYLFHPSYAPRKLSRTGHTAWVLATINFKPPALSEQGLMPAATLTLGATTGINITFTAGAGVFLSGDVGRVITSGAGRASITQFVSSTVVHCEIIDAFASTGPIASQSWSLLGSPRGSILPSAMEPEGSIITLTASDASEAFTDLLADGGDNWTVSGSGTNEYYLGNAAPFYSSTKPTRVYIDSVMAVEGALGSLGIIQWAWGDNDALGYNTIYVRLSDGVDPDTKAAPGDEDFLQKSTVTATKDLFRSSDAGKYVRVHSGLVKITAYASATSVSGEILKKLDYATATTNWTLESDVWNSANGYPSCGTFYEERLVLAGSTAYPETIWGSVVGDYENFTPGVEDSDALEFTLAGRQVNVIRWLEPREYLIVGTVGGEWRIGPEDTGDSLTPLNVVAKEERNYGSANISPVTVSGSTLFVQRAGRKIREFTYQWEQEGYVAPDLTLLAEHVAKGGLSGIVYQQEPLSIIWGWREDGAMVALTYLREEDVIGWHRHPTDGEIESMAVIPGTGYDEVWAVVKRAINGATVRYVEMLEELFNDTAAEYTANKGLNAFFVDSGITYNGAATTTISGLSHLIGETVAVLADGSMVSPKVVSAAGQITLTKAASVVHVGLPYTGTIQTMRLDAALNDGVAQGRVKKIHDVNLRVYRSGPFKSGRDANNLDSCYDPERNLTLGGAYPLFTGDIRIGHDGSWEKDARVMIVQDKPMPMTIVAVMPEASIS